MNPSDLTCPGIPAFETAEGFDCGEGIHLSGVEHSTVANNYVVKNAGGILLSDDTRTTHHILVSGNTVLENAFDCGITLASHRELVGLCHGTRRTGWSSVSGSNVIFQPWLTKPFLG